MNLNDFVKKYDPENQFLVIKDTWKQIEYAWNNQYDLSGLQEKKFSNIIVTGLGGSAISGDVLQNFLQEELNLPYLVNRSYSLPSSAGKDTLVIVSSYSGNTEETISVLEQAIKRGCSIVCIGSGGKISGIAAEHNIPYVKLPTGFQPRFALCVNFFTLLNIVQRLGIIAPQDSAISAIIELLRSRAEEYSVEGNYAFVLAELLNGYIPVIYGAADITSAAASRWKGQINENAKLHAFCNVIPELNHNEIIGWESFSDKLFNTKLINLIDEVYHPQVKRRFEITSELISNSGAEIINVSSQAKTFKERLFDLIYLGDWVSYYLALIRCFNPTSIKNINTLKERLAESKM